MKKIAFTQKLIETKEYYEITDALDVKWAELSSQIGFLPIIIPSNINPELYFKEIKIDGVILTGGNNLSTISDSPLSKQRDTLELSIIDYAIKSHIPILGICRGMQIIANYFNTNIKNVKNHTATEHTISITKNSKYYNNLNKLKSVNSYHNYSLKQCPEKFIISAYSNDNEIEAIEHTKLKIFGHMWHPERSMNNNELNFIKTFFNI